MLGHEFVGVVEEVNEGPGATPLTTLIGKRVVGEINAACHRADCHYCQQNMPTHCPNRSTLGIVNRDGAFAEYLSLPPRNLHVVLESVGDEEAVFVEPLAANFEMLEQVHVKPTDSIIVLGDGKMGQLAAQVLRLSGCEVLAVGKHSEKLALLEKQGVPIYLLDDAERFIHENGRRADIVVECTGSAQGLELALRMVRPRGVLIQKTTVSGMSTLHLASIVGSSSKKVSLLACEQEDDQQADGEEQSRRIKDAKKEVVRRDAGHAGVRGQNWRDRTSAVFAGN